MNEDTSDKSGGRLSWKQFSQGCEGFCFYASWATFILLIGQIICSFCGLIFPNWLNALLMILLAATVGYFTNYIAIKMLFEPYVKNPKHYLTIGTLGLWRQGLIPSKKDEIAVELGRQVERKLLNQEQIANEFCAMASDLLDNKSNRELLVQNVQRLLREHESQIVDFVYPMLEDSLMKALDDFMTMENLERFTNDRIIPFLQQEKVRQYIATMVVNAIKRNADDIMDVLKDFTSNFIYDYLKEYLPSSFAPFARKITDGIVHSIKWERLEWRIYEYLNRDDVLRKIANEIPNFLEQLREQWQSPEGRNNLPRLIESLKASMKEWLSVWLRESLPVMAKSIIESDSVWNWAKNEVLPNMIKPKIESWIQQNGKKLVEEKLRISDRVKEAVDKQDIAEFHSMINKLAGEHLSTIQVLGYILGGVIGVLQVLASCLVS